MRNNKLKKAVCVALSAVMACSGLQVQHQNVQAAIETENDTEFQTGKKVTDFTVEQSTEREIFAGDVPECMDVKVTKVMFEDGTEGECVESSSELVVSLEEGNTYQVGENTLLVTYMGCTKRIRINAQADEVVSIYGEQSNPIICPGDVLEQSDFEVAAAYRSGRIDSNYMEYEIVDTVVTDTTTSVTLRSANGIETVVDLTVSPLVAERIVACYNGPAVQDGCQMNKEDFTVTLIYNNGKEVVLAQAAFDLVYDNIVATQSNPVEVVYKENTNISETVYVTGANDTATEDPAPTATPAFTDTDKETATPEETPDSTPGGISGNEDPTENTPTTAEPADTTNAPTITETVDITGVPTVTEAVDTTNAPTAITSSDATSVPATTEPANITSTPAVTNSADATPEVVVTATPNMPATTTPETVTTDTPGAATSNPSGNQTTGNVTTGSSVATTSSIPTTTEAAEKEIILKNSRVVLTLGVGEKVNVTMSGTSAATYQSSNQKILSVTTKGIVTAKKVGKAKITATDEKGNTKTYSVTVKKAPKKVKVNFTKKTMKKGKKATIKISFAKGEYSSKNTFQSSRKSVATVNKKGAITAKRNGSCRITVRTYNGKVAEVKILVR